MVQFTHSVFILADPRTHFFSLVSPWGQLLQAAGFLTTLYLLRNQAKNLFDFSVSPSKKTFKTLFPNQRPRRFWYRYTSVCLCVVFYLALYMYMARLFQKGCLIIHLLAFHGNTEVSMESVVFPLVYEGAIGLHRVIAMNTQRDEGQDQEQVLFYASQRRGTSRTVLYMNTTEGPFQLKLSSCFYMSVH